MRILYYSKYFMAAGIMPKEGTEEFIRYFKYLNVQFEYILNQPEKMRCQGGYFCHIFDHGFNKLIACISCITHVEV